jgi:hypothetical protein
VGPCPAAYSTEAAEEIVPAIMETVVASLRELHARVPAAALPHVGGWSIIQLTIHCHSCIVYVLCARFKDTLITLAILEHNLRIH